MGNSRLVKIATIAIMAAIAALNSADYTEHGFSAPTGEAISAIFAAIATVLGAWGLKGR